MAAAFSIRPGRSFVTPSHPACASMRPSTLPEELKTPHWQMMVNGVAVKCRLQGSPALSLSFLQCSAQVLGASPRLSAVEPFGAVQ